MDIKNSLRKYADFKGRTSRGDYWKFMLAVVLIYSALLMVEEPLSDQGHHNLSNLFYLVMFIPLLSIQARRFHDIGRSGWYLLLGFIPVVGLLVWVVFSLKKGMPEANRFGPVPTKPVKSKE